MAKGHFSADQTEHLNTYLPKYIEKLDACASTLELTRWKQATATKALASPQFADLDFDKFNRTKWFEVRILTPVRPSLDQLSPTQMIVRKYTNYLHQVYRKTHPETVSPSAMTKANPLLKFSSVLSGRQMFARDMHDDVVAASKQRVVDKGTNDAATYQIVLKEMWDALSIDERAEWDTKAEDECGDVEL